MSNEIRIILRYAEPSCLDESSYGTACKVVSGDKYDLYVQINKHEDEKPNWLFVGTFNDDKFIEEEINNIIGKQ